MINCSGGITRKKKTFLKDEWSGVKKKKWFYKS